jgi:hypothetical protein
MAEIRELFLIPDDIRRFITYSATIHHADDPIALSGFRLKETENRFGGRYSIQ